MATQECFYCGHECIWQADFSGEDYGYDDLELDDGRIIKSEDLIVSTWVCPHCGSSYEILVGNNDV